MGTCIVDWFNHSTAVLKTGPNPMNEPVNVCHDVSFLVPAASHVFLLLILFIFRAIFVLNA